MVRKKKRRCREEKCWPGYDEWMYLNDCINTIVHIYLSALSFIIYVTLFYITDYCKYFYITENKLVNPGCISTGLFQPEQSFQSQY